MKTKEEILDEKTEDWDLTMSLASRTIALEAMEAYADEVSLGKTIQIHARDQQIEKYKELVKVMDKLYDVSADTLYELEIDPTEEMGKLYIKIQLLKTELGL